MQARIGMLLQLQTLDGVRRHERTNQRLPVVAWRASPSGVASTSDARSAQLALAACRCACSQAAELPSVWPGWGLHEEEVRRVSGRKRGVVGGLLKGKGEKGGRTGEGPAAAEPA